MSNAENPSEISICQGNFVIFLHYQNYFILKTKCVGLSTVKTETKFISFSKSQYLIVELLSQLRLGNIK